jgi:hypothetical protein
MATLYALLTLRPGGSYQLPLQEETLVEVVDLDSVAMQTVIPLSGVAHSFAVSHEAQRLYVVSSPLGPGTPEVKVLDTTGLVIGSVPLSTPGLDCALTKDGKTLFVATSQGIHSVDTSALAITNTIAFPTIPPPSPPPPWPWVYWWAAHLALSPDSTQLAAVLNPIMAPPPTSPSFPPPPPPPPSLWLLAANSLTLQQSIAIGGPTGTYYLHDVAYAPDTGLVLFLEVAGVLGAVKPQTGEQLPWTQTTPPMSIQSLTYSAKASRAYVASGEFSSTGPYNPYLWAMDPVQATAAKIEGFEGAPALASVHDEAELVYAAARRCWGGSPQQVWKSDILARYHPKTGTIDTNVYQFSSKLLAVAAMQAVPGSVMDPPSGKAGSLANLYAEQSVEVLVGLIGGGGGWVLTPGGKIKPVDPEPFQPTARRLRDIVSRVLRAGMLAQAANKVADTKLRRQIRSSALAYAKNQLAKAKIGERG